MNDYKNSSLSHLLDNSIQFADVSGLVNHSEFKIKQDVLDRRLPGPFRPICTVCCRRWKGRDRETEETCNYGVNESTGWVF